MKGAGLVCFIYERSLRNKQFKSKFYRKKMHNSKIIDLKLMLAIRGKETYVQYQHHKFAKKLKDLQNINYPNQKITPPQKKINNSQSTQRNSTPLWRIFWTSPLRKRLHRSPKNYHWITINFLKGSHTFITVPVEFSASWYLKKSIDNSVLCKRPHKLKLWIIDLV